MGSQDEVCPSGIALIRTKAFGPLRSPHEIAHASCDAMPKGNDLNDLCHEPRDFVGKAPPFFIRKIADDRRRDERVQMIAEHVGANTAESRNRRGDLLRDVDAVAPARDHLLQAAHLPFDPAKPRNLAGMIDGHSAMSSLSTRHA